MGLFSKLSFVGENMLLPLIPKKCILVIFVQLSWHNDKHLSDSPPTLVRRKPVPNNSCSYPSHILTILTKVFIHCSKSLNLGVPVSSMVTGPAWYCDRSYLCNTSSHKKSSLLNIPQSVVRGSDWDQQQLIHKVGVHVKSQSEISRCWGACNAFSFIIGVWPHKYSSGRMEKNPINTFSMSRMSLKFISVWSQTSKYFWQYFFIFCQDIIMWIYNSSFLPRNKWIMCL